MSTHWNNPQALYLNSSPKPPVEKYQPVVAAAYNMWSAYMNMMPQCTEGYGIYWDYYKEQSRESGHVCWLHLPRHCGKSTYLVPTILKELTQDKQSVVFVNPYSRMGNEKSELYDEINWNRIISLYGKGQTNYPYSGLNYAAMNSSSSSYPQIYAQTRTASPMKQPDPYFCYGKHLVFDEFGADNHAFVKGPWKSITIVSTPHVDA